MTWDDVVAPAAGLPAVDVGTAYGTPAIRALTPHYDNSPMVLVALPRADAALVRELLEHAWADRAPGKVLETYRADGGSAR